ncbi:MAG: DNA-protecting protein DprA, partial [Dokdonella sp.]
RDGAKLVETAEEVVGELAVLAQGMGASLRDRLQVPDSPGADRASASLPARSRPSGSTRAADPDYKKLFAALGYDTVGIDQLAQRSGLEIAVLSSMLLMLELEGEVVAARGGGYARCFVDAV